MDSLARKIGILLGSGSGSGDGPGSGSGYGITSFNGESVHYIDGVPTIIRSVHGNIARGAIINTDMTTTPTFIARVGDHFAHGVTLKKALIDARNKMLSDATDDERVGMFLSEYSSQETYSGHQLFEGHGLLTGSCEQGRAQFVRDREIDLDRQYTLVEFCELTASAYGAEVVALLKQTLKSIPETGIRR